jgi:hypothetical protein
VTLYQFKLLKENEQYATVWENGIMIDARITAQHKFILYQLEEFYVEIKYDAENNKLLGLKSFSSVMPLLNYLHLN